MKIRSVSARIVDIPFEDGGLGKGITPTTWNSLETVLIRVEDSDGFVGWGEAFGYFISESTLAMVDRFLKPLLEGTTVDSIESWNTRIQTQLHLFGRYGVTLFAISGVDMALWDLKAKREKVPLYQLLNAGTSPKTQLSTYASLVRYADLALAPQVCEQALDAGFDSIKLHEIDMAIIAACHARIDGRASVSVDVNCAWDLATSRANIETLKQLGHVSWLEEPIFPPEGFLALNSLRTPEVPLAAGENWCTAVQFEHAMQAGAVDYVQPSVSKVGGITECIKIMHLASQHGVGVLPHSPYFGPGFLATLHLAAAFPQTMQLEYLYVEPAGQIIGLDSIRRRNAFMLNDAPGIGLAPDEAVISRFVRQR